MARAGGRGCVPKKLRIAFYCWVKGYFKKDRIDYFPNFGERDLELIPLASSETEAVRIQRRTIPGYLTGDFMEAISMWRDWQRFGFPNAGGYLDQPSLWSLIVALMDDCARIMEVR